MVCDRPNLRSNPAKIPISKALTTGTYQPAINSPYSAESEPIVTQESKNNAAKPFKHDVIKTVATTKTPHTIQSTTGLGLEIQSPLIKFEVAVA
jgi:hypothetical protein